MIRLHPYVTLLTLTLLLAACDGDGGGSEATPTHAPTPTAPAPTPTVAIPNTAAATEIELPDGFTAYVVGDEFSTPTSVAIGPDGAIYVSQLDGPIFRLADLDRDGMFEHNARYIPFLPFANGIAFSPDGVLYISARGAIFAAPDEDGDGEADTIERIITGLPTGAHQNNGLAFGPDGKLYITNGSTCNECDEADERSATILQANLDGSDLRVYASGLRNPYDLTFDPQGRLWATDNGSDPPCNTLDELNLIEEGGDYGWPYSPTCDSLQSGIPPARDLGFNTAATGIAYYGAAHFPAEYGSNLFITLWGSNVEAPQPAGRVLVRVPINETGDETADETADELLGTVEEFGVGFDHPIDVVVDRDGTLLVLDFGAGKLYRIVYTGG
jgi:glucose/arabinose dehydrogenase